MPEAPRNPNANKNRGYLYPNVNKKPDNKQPDYRGKVTIEGKEWALSGWVEDREGQAMINIQATEPLQASGGGQRPPAGGSRQGGQGGGQGPSAGGPGAEAIGDIFSSLP